MDSPKRDSVRRHLSPEERQTVLTRYRDSQMTQRAFCAREGVGLSTLIKWLHDERKSWRRPVKFQEVILPRTTPSWAVEVVVHKAGLCGASQRRFRSDWPSCCARCHVDRCRSDAGAGGNDTGGFARKL